MPQSGWTPRGQAGPSQAIQLPTEPEEGEDWHVVGERYLCSDAQGGVSFAKLESDGRRYLVITIMCSMVGLQRRVVARDGIENLAAFLQDS